MKRIVEGLGYYITNKTFRKFANRLVHLKNNSLDSLVSFLNDIDGAYGDFLLYRKQGLLLMDLAMKDTIGKTLYVSFKGCDEVYGLTVVGANAAFIATRESVRIPKTGKSVNMFSNFGLDSYMPARHIVECDVEEPEIIITFDRSKAA